MKNSTIEKEKRMETIATITWKQVLTKGVQMMQVVEFNNIASYEDLPAEYLRESPYFYNRSDDSNATIIRVQYNQDKFGYVKKGDIFSLEEFQNLITTLKSAGKRLSQINKKIKQLKEVWNKTITITI